jgi:hypothetical protein
MLVVMICAWAGTRAARTANAKTPTAFFPSQQGFQSIHVKFISPSLS